MWPCDPVFDGVEEVRIDELEPLLTEDTDIVAVTEQPALSAADPSIGAPSTPATEVPALSPYEQQRLANSESDRTSATQNKDWQVRMVCGRDVRHAGLMF